MNHFTSSQFRRRYQALPKAVRDLADKNFDLLKADSHHPSLHFKKIANTVPSESVLSIARLRWKHPMAYCGFGSATTRSTTGLLVEPRRGGRADKLHFRASMEFPDESVLSLVPSVGALKSIMNPW